jgi:hypothetical protein
MCLTGGFALAMSVDPSVVAPVLSQPSLPFALSKRHKADPGVSADDLATVVRRTRDEELRTIGLRFSEDKLAPRERFGTLRRALGDGFLAVEIDSSPGNPTSWRPRPTRSSPRSCGTSRGTRPATPSSSSSTTSAPGSSAAEGPPGG